MPAIDIKPVVLDGEHLSIDDLVRVARGGAPIELAPVARERIERCRAFVEARTAAQAVMYGINTGIGELSEVVLPPEQIRAFQRYLVYSHAAGCG